jgi:hypothetical protein
MPIGLFLDKDFLLCVVKDKKLQGIITRGDLQRLFSSPPPDISSVTAFEVSNKGFSKLRLEDLENEVHRFFLRPNSRIRCIPVVDAQDNLITVLSVDSFYANMNWNNSQVYEFDYWENKEKELQDRIKNAQNRFGCKKKIENLFKIEACLEDDIMARIKDKTVLEIGCGPVCGYLPSLWHAGKRIAIEPLMDKYEAFWNGVAGVGIDEIVSEKHSVGADVFIPELTGKIDGMTISRNALDHTPNWPFILSNISTYSATGSYLYLWTDIHHAKKPNAGHYNITPSASGLCRMIENLGYKLLDVKTNLPLQRENIFVQLVAVKARS